MVVPPAAPKLRARREALEKFLLFQEKQNRGTRTSTYGGALAVV
jgi:hypothetical protein